MLLEHSAILLTCIKRKQIFGFFFSGRLRQVLLYSVNLLIKPADQDPHFYSHDESILVLLMLYVLVNNFFHHVRTISYLPGLSQY